MPTNPISEGDQIVVILNYFQGFDHTPPAPPRYSDNITGTVGWANTFYSGDGGSDHFMDFHVKTAVGGETSIDYDLPATTDLIAYVIRLNPEDHIEFSSGATPSATINSTTLPSVEGVTATADASLAWFLAANNNVDGAVLSNPGNYVLEVSQDDGDSIPTTGLTIWSQYINSENVTNTTDVTFDNSEGIRAHQIALSRKATWDTPVIEGHQFSSGTAGIADTFSPTNPAGMQVGDLLIHYYIANNDVDTTPTWNGDTAAWWNPICNIENNAGQDWRVTMGWRIWDGTEPALSILINTFGFSADVQCVMFRVTGHNPAAPIQQPFAFSIGNTGVTSYDIPVMNCAPNALSFINVTTWGSPTITTPPAGLDVYPSPTSTAQIFTGANEGQEPDPFGTVIWDPYNPAIGFVGFHIVGNPTYPAYTEFPLIENFISLDQEVTDWDNGNDWNGFW